MAVPKKRTSKSKSKSRKAKWKQKAYDAYSKSVSLGKSVMSGKSKSFIYVQQQAEKNL
uniref:Large ribosomal subunit protein bL32c n=1 Tax=Agarophyton chilense TaxID=2510777 RepID=A0A141SER7_AGACH|nr:ribosomal protein L32 [Agarophyton chilense]AMK96785.1 ribosomal protein L32 [Agarophyton chilense]ASP44680.1 50S ribosomal protein L32 [Agarophyton chilense]UAD84285.1 ribosomal protein L32 [Agarophyton chilense]